MVKKHDKFSFSEFMQVHYPDFNSDDVLSLYREAIMNGYPIEEVDRVVEAKLGDMYSLANQDQIVVSQSSVIYRVLAFFLFFVGMFSLILTVQPIYKYVLKSDFLAVNNVLQPVPMEEVMDSTPIAVEHSAENSPDEDSGVVKQNLTVSTDSKEPVVIDNLTYLKLDNWFDQQYLQDMDDSLDSPSTSGQVAGDFDARGANMPAAVENAYYLDIPKLGIEDAKVKIGANDLDKSLIQFSGTARPGELGSPVIFGHSVLRTFYNPKKTNKRRYVSIFSTLMTLERGDKIYIKMGDVKYTYMVTSKTEVQPTDTYILKQKKDYKKLKLVTCVPEGTYLRRGVVTAQLIEN